MNNFSTKEELFKYLKNNKDILIAEKKSVIKHADAINYGSLLTYTVTKTGTNKEITNVDVPDLKQIHVKIVINTTNILDSHGDVHIPGLWTKTLKERKLTYHIQEHCMKFDHIISDSVKASVDDIMWSELGESYIGKTQALIFDSIIEKSRNEYMFEQYANGWVRQHSVGMQYVNLYLCIDSNDAYYSAEKDAWDKYYPQVVNKDDVDEAGYFWAVTEAKLIEGSAVVLGSNSVTPTISVTDKQPFDDTDSGLQETADTLTVDEFRKGLRELLKN